MNECVLLYLSAKFSVLHVRLVFNESPGRLLEVDTSSLYFTCAMERCGE